MRALLCSALLCSAVHAGLHFGPDAPSGSRSRVRRLASRDFGVNRIGDGLVSSAERVAPLLPGLASGRLRDEPPDRGASGTALGFDRCRGAHACSGGPVLGRGSGGWPPGPSGTRDAEERSSDFPLWPPNDMDIPRRRVPATGQAPAQRWGLGRSAGEDGFLLTAGAPGPPPLGADGRGGARPRAFREPRA